MPDAPLAGCRVIDASTLFAGPTAAMILGDFGADVIKTNYSGDVDSFSQIVAATPVPIIVAGGPSKGEDDSTANMVKEVVAAGAAGVAIGRRVWQANDPQAVTAQIHKALFGAS